MINLTDTQKLRLTNIQAEAIKYGKKYYSEGELVSRYAGISNHQLSGGLKSLLNLSLDELIRAVYMDEYEVQPEFEEGQWVSDNKERIGKITSIEKEGEIWVFLFNENNPLWFYSHEIKHATEEQVEHAKKNQTWLSQGREYWELKKGDIISEPDGSLLTVRENIGLPEYNPVDIHVGEGLNSNMISSHYIRYECKIACFAEDRKDVGDE